MALNLTIVCLDQLFDQVQTQACTAVSPGGTHIGLKPFGAEIQTI